MTFSHHDEFGGKRIDATLVPGSTCVNSILTALNFEYANSTHSRLFRFAAAREHCGMIPDNCESGHRVQAFPRNDSIGLSAPAKAVTDIPTDNTPTSSPMTIEQSRPQAIDPTIRHRRAR